MRSRKEAWLLSLLVLHADAPLERSWLAGTLWPDALSEAALYNLRRSLHELRDALGSEAARILAPTPRTLRLDLDGIDCGLDSAACDLAAFDAAVRRGDTESLALAATLYRGPLLAGCLEEWVFPMREARERAALYALETLAAKAQERNDLADATAHLERALEIDPLRETALRHLMKTLSAQGRRAAASEAYRAFRLKLRAELNAEPALETITLCRLLRAEARQLSSGPQAVSSHTIPTSQTNQAAHLPIPLTALIGRRRETEAVAACLDGSRLVTLTGTGGVGKTRLALAVAQALHDEFSDGSWFADLSPLADPELVVQTVAAALGAKEVPGRLPLQALIEFLRPQHLLLIMDNCEHLVTACAHLTRTLLEQCPTLHILATSRETLGVPGEVQWLVPSLSLPADSGDDVTASEAVRLFVERAQQARPEWVLSKAEYTNIAEICRRLDGIPLAIEMAAARTRVLPVEAVAARLGDAFRLLSGPGKGFLPRQQTLRATLEWSWMLLDVEEKTLLGRLSVFAGGWTLEAAEKVCNGDGLEDFAVLDGLTGLIGKSLVLYEDSTDGEGRYRLLETIRQYARGKLHEQGETEAMHRRHYDYYLAWAASVEARLNDTDQADWLDRLEAEHENLRSALGWCQAQGETVVEAEGMLLRLAGALTHFWWIRGYQQEGHYFLATALERNSSGIPSAVRLKALQGAATLAQSQGSYDDAQRLYEQALEVARQLDDRAGEAAALGGLAETIGNLGDHATARSLLEEALCLNRERDDRHQVAANLGFLGYIARLLGDISAARTFLSEAVAISREMGDLLGVASHSGSLATLISVEGDYEQAWHLLEETLTLYRSLGNKGGIAWTLSSMASLTSGHGDLSAAQALLEEALAINRLLANRAGASWNLRSQGEIFARQGIHSEAERTLRQALAISREIGDQAGVAWCQHGLGTAARARGDIGAALNFEKEALREMLRLGLKTGVMETVEALATLSMLTGHPSASACLLGALGVERLSLRMPSPASGDERVDEILGGLREHLGDTAFEIAWAKGCAMSWEQALEYAFANDG